MHAAGKSFGKSYKSYLFFPICGLWSGEGQETRFFGRGDIQQKRKVLACKPCREIPAQFPPLVGYPDLPIRKTLMRVVVLLTVMILKRVSESIFFQSKGFTVCKVKDDKEVTNLNLLHNSSNIFLITVNGNLHLKFGHLSNFLLRRWYCINNWRLHYIDACSWKRLAIS